MKKSWELEGPRTQANNQAGPGMVVPGSEAKQMEAEAAMGSEKALAPREGTAFLLSSHLAFTKVQEACFGPRKT